MQANRADTGAPVSKWMLAIGVLAAPTAWLLLICAGETLIAHACFPHEVPLRLPLTPGVRWGFDGLSGVTFVVGAVGTWLAWRNLRRLTAARRRQRPETADTKVEGEAFVARVGLMSSLLFLFALVATGIATRLVSACG